MWIWWSLCTFCLLACQARVTVGDSGLCCCICVTSFERWLTPFACWFCTSAHEGNKNKYKKQHLFPTLFWGVGAVQYLTKFTHCNTKSSTFPPPPLFFLGGGGGAVQYLTKLTHYCRWTSNLALIYTLLRGQNERFLFCCAVINKTRPMLWVNQYFGIYLYLVWG